MIERFVDRVRLIVHDFAPVLRALWNYSRAPTREGGEHG